MCKQSTVVVEKPLRLPVSIIRVYFTKLLGEEEISQSFGDGGI
jgi:hypothetical protein